MTTKTTLTAFIAYLKSGEVVLRPAEENWSDMIRRCTQPGVTAEIREDDYDYFLDVLPPRWMGPGGYAFGEGADLLRLYWRTGDGKFLCRQLTQEEHQTFCRLAGVNPISR